MIIQHFLQWKDSADVSRRSAAASALGRAYLYSNLSFDDYCAAEAALTLLLDDPSEKVRYALAEVLSASANAPVQVVSALIHDQFAIASLVVARSPIVDDRDLILRVRTAENRLQVAIANRPRVSNRLARAVSEFGCAEACVTLLQNFNADICTACRNKIVARHVSDAKVRGALLQRKELEPDLRLKVLKAASTALSGLALFGKQRESGTSDIIVRDAEQRALVHMVGNTDASNVNKFIDAMRDNGDLTTQFLIRTACYGKMDFLAHVIADLSGQSVSRVTSILVNERATQLRALLSSAGLSDSVIPVFSHAIDLWRNVAQGRFNAGAQEVTRMVMERLETTKTEHYQAANDDILGLLRSIYFDTMRHNARRHAIDIASAA